MSGSRFWPSCQVNLGKLVPRSRATAGESKAVGEGSGAVEEGEGNRLVPEGVSGDPPLQNIASPHLIPTAPSN